jgi:RNA polymerase sigma-B factor
MTSSEADRDLDDLGLFREFAATRDRRVRNRLVERHMGLAAHIAGRFRGAGGTNDDLRQVAMLGLVKAVDRFDPEYGASFSSFAGRTIEGELKRHFRDRSWSVRVPRAAKELHLLVRQATDELSQRLGRSPTVDEVAAHLGVERDDVLRGLAATAAYRADSIDTAGSDGEDVALDRRHVLASDDDGYARWEQSHVVRDLLAQLPPRDRRIVELRFFDQMSQSEIAEVIGISQMHVSRLLRRSFDAMRAAMDAPAPPDAEV